MFGVLGIVLSLVFPEAQSDRTCVFKSARLVYDSSGFRFDFEEISGFFDTFQVEVNRKTTMKVNGLKRLSSIPLDSLISGENNEIRVRFDQKTYAFYLFLPRTVEERGKGFSFNDLIDDAEGNIEFQNAQYFQMQNYESETGNSLLYFDLNGLPDFSFDARYVLADQIEMVLFSDGLFPSLDSADEFHFLLSSAKKEKGYAFVYRGIDPSFHPEAGKDFYRDELYFEKFFQAKRIDVRVTLKRIYGSPIDLFFEQTVDLAPPLFGKEGTYAIRITDSEEGEYEWGFDL